MNFGARAEKFVFFIEYDFREPKISEELRMVYEFGF